MASEKHLDRSNPYPGFGHTLDYKALSKRWHPIGSGMIFDSGKALITERGGHLRLWQNGTLVEPVKGIPVVLAEGQGGLLMCPGLITLRMAGFTCPTVMRKRWMEPTNPMP